MCNRHQHYFVDDFVDFTIDFPFWFTNLGLDQDCNEAVKPNSPPGSLTSPSVYQNLVLFLHDICKYSKEYEVLLPPRGCNMIINQRPQFFMKYEVSDNDENVYDRPIIVVFPRARARASNRNVPEFVWYETVMKLSQTFLVVIAGTPSGACLQDMGGENIINLVGYNEQDKVERTISYLNKAICSVSSQSGGTHISLLSGCASYILGHEKDRHTVELNRFEIPTSFRFVQDYRAIDSNTILQDLKGFIDALFKSGWFSKLNRPSLRTLEGKKDLIGVEIGTDRGDNALNMLENLDIKKLYLIDPYSLYRNLTNIGCNITEEQCVETRKEAHSKLEKYKDRVVWIEDLSENAVSKIPDNLDFVYVDGNHRCGYVLGDLKNYFPKLKDGGLITCHDYDYPDVKKAFNEFFNGCNVAVGQCSDNSERQEAWFIKPDTVDSIISEDYNKLVELVENA